MTPFGVVPRRRSLICSTKFIVLFCRIDGGFFMRRIKVVFWTALALITALWLRHDLAPTTQVKAGIYNDTNFRSR
jgi:hypothetical protein